MTKDKSVDENVVEFVRRDRNVEFGNVDEDLRDAVTEEGEKAEEDESPTLSDRQTDPLTPSAQCDRETIKPGVGPALGNAVWSCLSTRGI